MNTAVDVFNLRNKLVATGLTPEAAEMSLSVTQDLLTQADFATRADLSRLGAELGAKIDKVDAALSARIDKVEAELGARIDRLDIKVDKLALELGGRIDKLDAKIDKVSTSLGAQIDRLTWKVGVVVSILVFAVSHINDVLRFIGQLARTP